MDAENASTRHATSHAKPRATGRRPSVQRFYVPGTYRPEDSVGYLMKRISMSIVQLADRRLAPQGLTYAQWAPLLQIQKAGGASPVLELARCMQTDAGAMTRMLDRLEKKGLCQRTRSDTDRRVVRVALTAAGEAAVADVPAVLAEVVNEHLEGFTRDEWLQLKALLHRVCENGDRLRVAGDSPATVE